MPLAPRARRVLSLTLAVVAGTVMAAEHAAFFARRETGYLQTRDGVALRYSVLLPSGPGPFPAILNYSGYDPGAIGGAAYLSDDTAMSVNLDATLVEHGYAVVGVNARGTGCSEGVFDFLGPAYGLDGHDAVEFMAGQPWSDGHVGMANWSWAGMSQLATASTRPPHLTAIAPGMTLGDIRLDSWAPGGVPAPAFVAGWWQYLHSRWASVEASAQAEQDHRCLTQLQQNRTSAEDHTLSDIIIRHPLRDAYIEERHLAARTHRINVPVLSMTAYQDEAVTSREGHYHDTLDPEQLWRVQTNGGHDLYESRRFRSILVDFFDHFLKGTPNGFETRPHREIWLESTASGHGHERQESIAPRAVLASASGSFAVGSHALYLDSHGRLIEHAADAKGTDEFRYPRPGPTVNADDDGETDRWGRLPDGWREGSVAYTSAPLEEPWLAIDGGSVDVWVALEATTDADLEVTLTELRPEGQEMYVQRGWLRLSNRALDTTRSTALRPVPLDLPDAQKAMTPGVPAMVRVELPKFAHPFRKGSRIRLWIGTPSQTGGYGFAPYSADGTVRIQHDAEHPSRLLLGLTDSGIVPAQRPVCGSVLRQPCRPDPLATSAHSPIAPKVRP